MELHECSTCKSETNYGWNISTNIVYAKQEVLSVMVMMKLEKVVNAEFVGFQDNADFYISTPQT